MLTRLLLLTHGAPNGILVKPSLASGLHPDFRKLSIGQTVSEFGSRITRGGLPLIAVITLAATPAQMGFLAAIASIPVLLFSLFAGVWVDRLRRRPIMIAMDLTRMVLLLTIPAAALTGHLTMELLYVLIAALGVLGLIFEIAYHAYLPSLIEREHVVEGNSKLSTSGVTGGDRRSGDCGCADSGDQCAAGSRL